MKQLMIITGATSGIGLECVKQFLELNDLYILAIGRDFDKFDVSSDRVIQCICDVTDFNQISNAVDKYKADYKIIGLINSAGFCYIGGLSKDNHAKNSQMINVNIQGITNVIEIILPIMQLNKFGTIMNLSSLADRYPRPNNAIYAATKAYVKSLSDSLRMDNAKYNIRIINLAPALVETPMVTSILGINEGTIKVDEFVQIVKQIYLQPHNICVRDIVIAPTSYEG